VGGLERAAWNAEAEEDRVQGDGRRLRVIGEWDVAVVGSGAAGISAAVTAARYGARTVLVERQAYLGGMGTGGMVGVFCGLYTGGPEKRAIPSAFGGDVTDRLAREGACGWSDIRRTRVVHYDVGVLKVVYDALAAESGVELLLQTGVTGVLADEGQVYGLVVDNVEYHGVLLAKQVIDASGDASVVHWTTGRTEKGGAAGETQGATLVFRMANVDTARAVAVSRDRFSELIEQANREGTFNLPRTDGYFFATTHPGEVNCNMTRVAGLDTTMAAEATLAEVVARQQVQEYARFLRARVPGFRASYLSFYGSTLGIRETRRIVGDYVVTEDDLRVARAFDDGVAYAAWPMEIHAATGDGTVWGWLPDDAWLEIPHRALLPLGLTNVQAAGRCISTTHEALGSTRVMGTCMSMGEAVGVAAAQAARRGLSIRELPMAELRGELDAYRRVETDTRRRVG